jgi:hypothetical protein
MGSEIVESSGERTMNHSKSSRRRIFLASRISHSICASQVSSYFLRTWTTNETLKSKIPSCEMKYEGRFLYYLPCYEGKELREK